MELKPLSQPEERINKIPAFLRWPSPARGMRETGTIVLRGEAISFTIVRSARRKRTVAFTVDPGTGLRVMAPLHTGLVVIRAMLQGRSAWILRKMAEREKIVRASLPKRFADGERISYLGHSYQLRILQDAQLPQGCRIMPHTLTVNIADAALSGENLRQEVRLEILLWLKKRAKVKFRKRMDIWAERLGVEYTKLLVTSSARQWGSCAADDIIRLNWRLMMAPLPLIDYVVAHELGHILHKNHSPRFWQCLARVMPDYQARRKQLRQIGGGLVL